MIFMQILEFGGGAGTVNVYRYFHFSKLLINQCMP